MPAFAVNAASFAADFVIRESDNKGFIARLAQQVGNRAQIAQSTRLIVTLKMRWANIGHSFFSSVSRSAESHHPFKPEYGNVARCLDNLTTYGHVANYGHHKQYRRTVN